MSFTRLLVLLVAVATPTVSFAEAAAPSVVDPVERSTGFKLRALQFAGGAAAGLVSVPAAVGGAIWLGSLSSNLILAALPSVALFVALPPVAVTLAAWWVGERLAEGSSTIRPALWAGLGAQLLVLAGAILLNAHGTNLVDVALLSVAEAVLLPGAVVGTMAFTAPDSRVALRRGPIDPSRPGPDRLVAVPLLAWRFE